MPSIYISTNQTFHGDQRRDIETSITGSLQNPIVMSDGRTQHDAPPLSLKVLTTVAEHERGDETKLPLLSEAIDPDALNSLFASPPTEKQREPAYVNFPYADHRVVVYDDRTVVVK